MASEEEQAALEFARLIQEKRELCAQLAKSFRRKAELIGEAEELKHRLADLKRQVALQGIPFRRREP